MLVNATPSTVSFGEQPGPSLPEPAARAGSGCDPSPANALATDIDEPRITVGDQCLHGHVLCAAGPSRHSGRVPLMGSYLRIVSLSERNGTPGDRNEGVPYLSFARLRRQSIGEQAELGVSLTVCVTLLQAMKSPTA